MSAVIFAVDDDTTNTTSSASSSEDEEVSEGDDEQDPQENAPPRASVAEEEEEREKEAWMSNEVDKGGGEGQCSSSQNGWNREDVEGLFCSICMEPWSNSGEHLPSCLACGHLFGMSCIKKWLKQRRNSGKCPQCNTKSTLKDVRRIYGSRVVVVDEESQKMIRSLEAKCAFLEKKNVEWTKKENDWRKKVFVWQKREAELCGQVQQLTERTVSLERTLGELQSQRLSSSPAVDWSQGQPVIGHRIGSNYTPVSPYEFTFQQEVPLNGARHFDVDDFSQLLIIARRPMRIGGCHILTKMSLFSPHEQDDVLLPSTFKAVRDLHVSPYAQLTLLASMGKKLSVLSMESKNIVLDYDLPAEAWSCSWDVNSSHYVYAGLQNGMLLVFDLRQTTRPLEARSGLSSNPMHTLSSLPNGPGDRPGTLKLISGSKIGLSEWNFGVALLQPSLIADTVNRGVCISYAYCPSSDNVVATYRPTVQMSDGSVMSQTQTNSSPMGYHVQGSHVHIKREGSSYQTLGSVSAYVPGILLPKYRILTFGDENSVFASGDEAMSSLDLQQLPSFTVTQRLPSSHPIRDIKYSVSLKPSLLCCLSEDRILFFSPQLS